MNSKYEYTRPFPTELKQAKREIEALCRKEGLDFFDVIFEMVTRDEMCEFAAYLGFPSRYPHWSFGQEYDYYLKHHQWDQFRISEMVINNDPAIAYLMDSNGLVDQQMVMAHVYGHVDFFKNNAYFKYTNRKMLNKMANHASLVRRYIDIYGDAEVEAWVDICLSIQNLIDPHSVAIRRTEEKSLEFDFEDPKFKKAGRFDVDKDYMERYINTPDFIEHQKKTAATTRKKDKNFPARPMRDVVLFLYQYAALPKWKVNILGMIREESYYFAPQAMTKILNEGWASYWHSHVMTKLGIAGDSGIVDYATHCAGTWATDHNPFNPYKLGVELFRDIEERWDKGQFGEEWDKCEDLLVKQAWDKKLGLGREKIFEVRELYNDVTFLETFLTPDFCLKTKIFDKLVIKHYGEALKLGKMTLFDAYNDLKRGLLFQMTNRASPFIYVINGNYQNRGELLLRHTHDGQDLDLPFAQATLENIYRIWQRPVYLETIVNKNPTLYSHKESGFTTDKQDDSADLFIFSPYGNITLDSINFNI